MTTATLTVRPFPTMGAEVTDVDLARLDDETFRALLEAWWTYGILVFPALNLNEDDQITFSQRLGRLERLISKKKQSGTSMGDRKARIGKLSNVDKNGEVAPEGSSLHLFLKGNQYWHSDSSFKRVSAKASMLSAWTVPSTGGETEWADMRQAYDALPPDQKDFWSDKIAVHSYRYSQSQVGGLDVLSEDEWDELPPVEHPVVRKNPDSGRTSLFIGRHASHLRGMDVETGRRLLGDLVEWATQPRWVHTHHWRRGDSVLWDNRSVLHRGRPWPASEPRIMKRTTMAGDGDNEWTLGEV